MNQLRATSYDASINLDRLSGEVRYVFDRACYLAHPDGQMTLIIAAETGDLPGGICIDIPEEFKFSEMVIPGALVAARGGVLRFEGADLSIELRFAHPRISPPRGAFAGRGWEATETAWNEAWAAVMLHVAASPHGSDRLFQNFSQLVDEFTESRDPWVVVDRAKRFLGRGPGLTPAGDDFIVGYLAGAWLVGLNDDDDTHDALAAWINRSLDQTSDVSKNFLSGATRGVFPERLVSLCAVIVGAADFGAVGNAIRHMAAFGQSSGLSMALGLLCALISRSERIDRPVWEIDQTIHTSIAGVAN